MKSYFDIPIERYFGLPELNYLDIPLANDIVAKQELPTDFKCVDPKGYVGLEVEVENVLDVRPNVRGFWDIVADNSLRLNGQEFVSRPMPSSFVYPALHQLFLNLNKEILFSKRTSVHVHLNTRNLNLDQLMALLLLYSVVEPLFFKYVEGNRNNNIFCVPWNSSGNIEDLFEVIDNIKNLNKYIRGFHRYSALNLNSLEKFGTIEFRHMPGTSDIKKIASWVNLITSLRVFILRQNVPQITATLCETIGALNTNSQYLEFLTSIFEDNTALLDTSRLITDLERPVTEIKKSKLNNKFHTTITNEFAAKMFDSRLIKHYIAIVGKSPKKSIKNEGFESLYADFTAAPVDNWATEPVVRVQNGTFFNTTTAIHAPNVQRPAQRRRPT